MDWPSRDNRFLVFLCGSLLLHLLAFWVLSLAGGKGRQTPPPATMIDLSDLRTAEELAPPKGHPVERRSDQQRRRVERERAPRGEEPQARKVEIPRPVESTVKRSTPAEPPTVPEKSTPRETARPGETASSQLLRRRTPPAVDGRLLPGVDRLARLEEGYRKKYGPEVAESDTTFLNTGDFLFGSFLKRFEDAVYGVWRYPADASRLGVEGVTAVRITFNRRGEVETYEILEGSGSRLLDEEVGRTIKTLGRIGGFPSGYTKEHYHLIAFFHYSIVRGSIRGTLR